MVWTLKAKNAVKRIRVMRGAIAAVGISPLGLSCPRTEPLVAALAAYKGCSESFLPDVCGWRGGRPVASSPPGPPVLPAVAGAGPQSTLINLNQ